MEREGSGPDARRAYRVASAGVGASCHGKRFRERYQVENLSAGGALLSAGYVPPVGEEVRLRLLLPQAQSLDLEAQVVRHHFRSDEPSIPHFPGALAVKFAPLSSEQADALHDTVVDIILRDWEPAPGSHQ